MWFGQSTRLLLNVRSLSHSSFEALFWVSFTLPGEFDCKLSHDYLTSCCERGDSTITIRPAGFTVEIQIRGSGTGMNRTVLNGRNGPVGCRDVDQGHPGNEWQLSPALNGRWGVDQANYFNFLGICRCRKRNVLMISVTSVNGTMTGDKWRFRGHE